MMWRLAVGLMVAAAISGCGMAETGAAAAGGASKSEEVRQAQETQERFRQQLEQAAEQAAQQRAAAEAAMNDAMNE